MRLIIAGGRDFNDYDVVLHHMNLWLADHQPPTEIICGGARGADELGKWWAFAHRIRVIEFPADWKQFGRKAGPVRNDQMARYANALLAFWDGESKGTANMIEVAARRGLMVKVVEYSTAERVTT